MKRLLVIALATVAALAVSSYALGECGNGVVDPGEECEPITFEVCTNNQDDDLDGLTDCLDPDCTPEGTGTMFTCGQDCYAVPTCQPLLDDPGKIKFKMPKRLDYAKVSARVAPVSSVDPLSEDVSFSFFNTYTGDVYSETVPALSFIPNSKGTTFKFKVKKNGTAMINFLLIKEKMVKGVLNYIVKVKLEGDLAGVDPERNPGLTESQLGRILTQFVIGDDTFYINADWIRTSSGWKLPDKYMQAN